MCLLIKPIQRRLNETQGPEGCDSWIRVGMLERITLQLPSAYAPVRTPEMGSYYTPITPLLSKIVQKRQSSDIETDGRRQFRNVTSLCYSTKDVQKIAGRGKS
ncbi:hypothetical protein AVEN_173834-1 [Araneus ventricosus]|uniref:Uncharacterized protein n=1 Tax=Araneus ventricosus TaxID=182803 RepID=A0A4Y2CH80_ARAVE|nr:hypothetical protein AVEN_173834-1 [Araneus ventricosus]